MSFKLALLCLGLSLTYANAQVGMPTNNPNKDAVLDLNRTDGTSNKGLLLTKVALTGTNNFTPMTAHVAGMHVWNTATTTGTNAVIPGEYYNDGAKWVRVSSSTDVANEWLLDGNTNGALKTIGTKDNFDLPFITNNTEKMRLTSSGFLGIGTDTPLAGIHLKSDDRFGNNVIFESGASDGSTLTFVRPTSVVGTPMGVMSFNTEVPVLGATELSRIVSAYRGTDLSAFYFFLNRSSKAQMTLNENGYLALGTTSPAYGFHMVSDISDGRGINGASIVSDQYTASASAGPQFYADKSRGTVAVPENIVAGDKLGTFGFRGMVGGSFTSLSAITSYYQSGSLSDLRFMTSNATRMTIDENGNVGIGTINPAQKLDVNGSIKSTTALIVSDARYKTNIETLQKPLEIVNRLRGTSYFMNTKQFPDKGFSEGKQYGVIAQEVEKILPDLVTTGIDGYKAVNYQGFIPVLIEAVKTQQTEIENQKKELAGKESEIKDLKDRMTKLEKTVNGLLK
ncbi:Chaperone of endosialidase [Flavobacterium phragmitis]|uniref:Chaperone of endosialidase n=2 Tax=Flavobacterium phragmitis TaxID=739143 RepID=A0A1I1TU49_9FLAO|nr:Chaperone of endosialidase [Flavobacterium phragmitis]